MRADYAEKTLKKLSSKLTDEFGRGFSQDNLERMRKFYLIYNERISASPMRKSIASAEKSSKIKNTSISASLMRKSVFPFKLSWTHYVFLMNIKDSDERNFYEIESMNNNWSIRELQRQFDSSLYERLSLSKNKAKVRELGKKGQLVRKPSDLVKDRYVLEFLNLKEEYAYTENELETAIINKIEHFLLELGGYIAFIGRQKRLRIGNEWYKVDLVFFHRKLRCLVIIDLKLGKFTHADAGQMHMYLNYAKVHWMNKDENPPVGLILCSEKDNFVVKYSLGGLSNKILAAEYKLKLPDEKLIAKEIAKTRRILERRRNI